MNCETCQELLLDRLIPEPLGDGEGAARVPHGRDYQHGGATTPEQTVDEHLVSCDDCTSLWARLQAGADYAAQLHIAEPPPSATDAIMAAARAHVGAPPAKVDAPPTAKPAPPSWWDRVWGGLASFAAGPQVAMATIMLMVVAFGVWYVPRSGPTPQASGPIVLHPSPTEPQPEPEPEPEATVGGPAEVTPTPSAAAEAPDAPPQSNRSNETSLAVADPAPSPADAPNTLVPEPPTETEPEATPEPATPEDRVARGVEAYGNEDYRGAIDELDAVVQAPGVPRTVMPTALHHLARSYRANDDCAQAVVRYRQLFRAHPLYGQIGAAMVEAGSCYRRLGQFDEARRMLDLAAEQASSAVAAREELRLLRRDRARREQRNRLMRRPSGMNVGRPTRDRAAPSRMFTNNPF